MAEPRILLVPTIRAEDPFADSRFAHRTDQGHLPGRASARS